jgi:hypothetical protein
LLRTGWRYNRFSFGLEAWGIKPVSQLPGLLANGGIESFRGCAAQFGVLHTGVALGKFSTLTAMPSVSNRSGRRIMVRLFLHHVFSTALERDTAGIPRA